MTTRSYSQFCGLACALDLVGDRWALLVLRELWLGPRRFRDLLAGIPGCAPRALTTRLVELEESGLIARRQAPAPVSAMVYELTAQGRALEPVLVELARFGAPRVVAARRGAPKAPKLEHRIRASWLALALRASFDPARAKGVTGRLQLELPSGAFAISLDDGRASFIDGLTPGGARLIAAEPVVLGLVSGELTLKAAVEQGRVELDGDPAEVKRVLAAFPMAA